MGKEKTYQQDQIELHKTLASYYDKRYRYEFSMIFQSHWNSEMLSLCPEGRDGWVLDFGCGTGIFFRSLAGRYDNIVGSDISRDMMLLAPKGIPQIKGLIAADGAAMPFLDGAFDLVVCRSSLHHMPDLDNTLLEIKRILAPGGVLVFSEPSNDNVLIRMARYVMYKFSHRFDERDRAFHERELASAVEALGFRVEAVKRFGFFSYLLSGFPDHLPLMIYVPFSAAITRALIRIDKFLCAAPFIRSQSFHVMFRLANPGGGPRVQGEDLSARLACPRCKQRLSERENGFECLKCGLAYPVSEGVAVLIEHEAAGGPKEGRSN